VRKTGKHLTRSFLYIDECLNGIRQFLDPKFNGLVNIESEEMVTINQIAEIAIALSGKTLLIKHIPRPLGIRGRKSGNKLIQGKIG